jgi:hypothetical protein
VTTTTEQRAPGAAKKRGRETAVDMLRSLALVLLVVIPIWFLAQPPDSAEQRIRVVDQAPDVAAWRTTADPAPVPAELPDGWRPTVGQFTPEPPRLRLGWNTPDGAYAEFAATTGAAARFVEELTGASTSTGTVDVDGAAWQRYEDDDGSVSLVRSYGEVTVVVGTRRTTASLDELLVLAAGVAVG